jgi:hypothetical protein
MDWTKVHGTLTQGYRVASGPSADYPYGALDRQRPIFKERGLDLDAYFNGSLNVDISPAVFVMQKPEFTFENVAWTDLHPPEHFSFSRCKVLYKEVEYDGWIYYPHPETKKRHFQNPSLLEVIAQPIPEIKYGDELEVLVNPDEIGITSPQPKAAIDQRGLYIWLAILSVLALLAAAISGIQWWRKNHKPQAYQRFLVTNLTYCNSDGIKPCIESFSVDADGNMLVSVLTPDSSYPDFYLTISNDTASNKYECQKVEDFPTNVSCTGQQMNPGAPLQFTLTSIEGNIVLAEGKFAIIGLMLPNPNDEASETPTAAETSLASETLEQTQTPAPIPLEILTPIPTKAPTSYPNATSYPNYP